MGSGIERVAVRKLRLSSRVRKGDRITVEADVSNTPEAVYDLLEQVSRSTPLHLYSVTQVELAASVVMDAEKPPERVSIRITYPNSCSLKYDERDLKLRGDAGSLRHRTQGTGREKLRHETGNHPDRVGGPGGRFPE